MYVLSKVIHRCDSISKGLLHYVLWLVKEFAPPSQPIRFKTKANRVLVTYVFPRFRQFAYLWVLIGSLRYFRPIRFKTKANQGLFTQVFPPLRQFACFFLCSHWLLGRCGYLRLRIYTKRYNNRKRSKVDKGVIAGLKQTLGPFCLMYNSLLN